MKPILVLGPEQPGAPSLERGQVDLCRLPPAAHLDAGRGVYDSIIVINDGGADTIRRLQMALEMRGRHAHLPIGVLTYLASPAPLNVDLKQEVLSLEYQAD